jgi:GNAT superfamily N-acetyltransferase
LSNDAHFEHARTSQGLDSGRGHGGRIGQGEAMTRNYPNITPPNDLRLPDALTIKHGPSALLARFVLEGDKLARTMGIRLRLRHDFKNFLTLNEFEVARGNWYPLVDIFQPEHGGLSPENAYWISGETDDGEIVVTQAGRVYYWPETSLADEARDMFYGGRTDPKGPCIVKAADASKITGVVFFGGAVWVRPDFRGLGLSHLMPRLGRAYATARWPIDWGISLVKPALVDKGVAKGYGYKHESRSLFFPGHQLGDLEVVLVYISRDEAYEDLATFLTDGIAGASATPAPAVVRAGARAAVAPSVTKEETVTRISEDLVAQGSRSRS